MLRPASIALLRFPTSDLDATPKLRPVLVLKKASEKYDDWLVSLISTKVHQFNESFDELLKSDHSDFSDTGLKKDSVIRLSYLFTTDASNFEGLIGSITEEIYLRICSRLSSWMLNPDFPIKSV